MELGYKHPIYEYMYMIMNAINEEEKTSLCLTLFRANLIRMYDVVNHQMNISFSHKLFRCV